MKRASALTPLLALLLLGTGSSYAVPFDQCIEELQRSARAQQLPERIITDVLGQLRFQSRVIELDRSQPEFTQTFADYLNKRVTAGRVERAQKHFDEQREFLTELTLRYGVPGRYLIAFWGLETNFGSYLGKMPTLDVLATLACDDRRSDYFRAELMTALRVLERENLDPKQMKGSWAGAMGHTQFMPSAYEKYAVDGDGDGRVDLWGSRRDALTSAANFLKELGWNSGERWGREVLLPKQFPWASTGLAQPRTLREWVALGVTNSNGSTLPLLDLPAAILLPMGHSGPAFIAYDNFHTIMRWNFSESYAIAVGHLADRIAGGTTLVAPLKAVIPGLSPRLITQMQLQLSAQGFDTGSADGIMGPATRAALRSFQSANQLIADGYPSLQTFSTLKIAID
ncbi:MAG: membrane-bound lytic murein transglycosylase B [Paraglaciecola psychrophila]|jgi:membrane-bound lytic murein transglycosylase B